VKLKKTVCKRKTEKIIIRKKINPFFSVIDSVFVIIAGTMHIPVNMRREYFISKARSIPADHTE
jgi:hypothetical protein